MAVLLRRPVDPDRAHSGEHAESSDIFLHHTLRIETAKRYYDAEIVEPQSVYVNLMVSIDGGGPAHTDNPRIHGRDGEHGVDR